MKKLLAMFFIFTFLYVPQAYAAVDETGLPNGNHGVYRFKNVLLREAQSTTQAEGGTGNPDPLFDVFIRDSDGIQEIGNDPSWNFTVTVPGQALAGTQSYADLYIKVVWDNHVASRTTPAADYYANLTLRRVNITNNPGAQFIYHIDLKTFGDTVTYVDQQVNTRNEVWTVGTNAYPLFNHSGVFHVYVEAELFTNLDVSLGTESNYNSTFVNNRIGWVVVGTNVTAFEFYRNNSFSDMAGTQDRTYMRGDTVFAEVKLNGSAWKANGANEGIRQQLAVNVSSSNTSLVKYFIANRSDGTYRVNFTIPYNASTDRYFVNLTIPFRSGLNSSMLPWTLFDQNGLGYITINATRLPNETVSDPDGVLGSLASGFWIEDELQFSYNTTPAVRLYNRGDNINFTGSVLDEYGDFYGNRIGRLYLNESFTKRIELYEINETNNNIHAWWLEGSTWRVEKIHERSAGFGSKLGTVGDADNNGKNELYFPTDDCDTSAANNQPCVIRIYWNNTAWKNESIYTTEPADAATDGWGFGADIGDAEPDGLNELYMWKEDCSATASDQPCVVQLKWNGTHWNNVTLPYSDGDEATQRTSLVLGDAENTGVKQIYTSHSDVNSRDNITQYKWNGTGFSRTTIVELQNTGFNIGEILIDDANNDGLNEIYAQASDCQTGGGSTGCIVIFRYNGSAWNRTNTSLHTSDLDKFGIGDADWDGLKEIYASSDGTDELFQFKWNGASWIKTKIGGLTSQIAAGDIDGDGAIEIYGRNSSGRLVQYKWNGTTFVNDTIGGIGSSGNGWAGSAKQSLTGISVAFLTNATGRFFTNITVATNWTDTYAATTPNGSETKDYDVLLHFPVNASEVRLRFDSLENSTANDVDVDANLYVTTRLQNTSILNADGTNQLTYNITNGDTLYAWVNAKNVRNESVSGKTTDIYVYSQGQSRSTAEGSFLAALSGGDGWTGTQSLEAQEPNGTWSVDVDVNDTFTNTGAQNTSITFVGFSTLARVKFFGSILFWNNGTAVGSAAVTAKVYSGSSLIKTASNTSEANGRYLIAAIVDVSVGSTYMVNITASKDGRESFVVHKFTV